MSGNVPIPRPHSSNRHVAAFPCIESIITENMKITIQKFYRNYSQYPAMVGNVFPSKFITWTCGRAFGNTESIIINQRDMTTNPHTFVNILSTKEKNCLFSIFSEKMWRADESGLMALPWSEPRTKRGQMWKYSASKSERLKGQIRNHRSGKYRPATFVQIRNHHQTDRDICHFTKFPTTLDYFGKFWSMTKNWVNMSKYVSTSFFSK